MGEPRGHNLLRVAAAAGAAALVVVGCGGEVAPAAVDAGSGVTDAGTPHVVDAGSADAELPCDASGTCPPPPVVIATNQTPDLVAVDGTNVYWTSTGLGTARISFCAVGGCNDTPTVLWSWSYFSAVGLAVVGPGVYFPAGTQYVATCAVAGCNNTPTNLVSTLSENITGFAADQTRVYWAGSGGGVQSCDLAGCDGVPTTLGASPQGFYLGLAVGPTRVFWSDATKILACPKTGCAGPPTVLASGRVGPWSVATDGKNVYWIELGKANGGGKIPLQDYSDGAVLSCAVTGCNDSPTVLASYPTWRGGNAIAADASGVYWSTDDASGTLRQIVGCAAGGCGGHPKVYATTSSTPNWPATRGVAVDATNVYWTNRGLGEVLTAPK